MMPGSDPAITSKPSLDDRTRGRGTARGAATGSVVLCVFGRLPVDRWCGPVTPEGDTVARGRPPRTAASGGRPCFQVEGITLPLAGSSASRTLARFWRRLASVRRRTSPPRPAAQHLVLAVDAGRKLSSF